MVLGERVDGLMMDKGWRFVTGDAHDIHRRVQEIDPDARLVAHESTREIGVANWVQRSRLGDGDFESTAETPVQDRGGAWLLAFRIYDDSGLTYKGEPTDEVITQLNRAAVGRRRREDLERFYDKAKAHHDNLMRRWGIDTENVLGDMAERAVHGHYEDEQRPFQHIYVPKGV